MNPLYLLFVFIASSILGYLIIKNVPSLLHAPLMSGMNALSGITILGAVTATGLSVSTVNNDKVFIGLLLGGIAIMAAAVNIVGGFGVTHKMLKMFDKKEKIA